LLPSKQHCLSCADFLLTFITDVCADNVNSTADAAAVGAETNVDGGGCGGNDEEEEIEVIRCICNIYCDEGLMIQCDNCEVTDYM